MNIFDREYLCGRSYSLQETKTWRSCEWSTWKCKWNSDYSFFVLHTSAPHCSHSEAKNISCRIWGSHTAVAEGSCLLVCKAVSPGEWFSTFWTITVASIR